jgi:hypothetical protein
MDPRGNIRARSTRLAGSVRDRAIDFSFATSASLIDNSNLDHSASALYMVQG